MAVLFDTHLHCREHSSPADLFAEARQAGVGGFILAATGTEDAERYARTAAAEAGVFATVGVHPHQAEEQGTATGWALDLLQRFPDCIAAVGEVGLDYYYDHSPRDIQRAVFEAYLTLACEQGLPLVVHCREAYEDCFAVLRSFGDDLPPLLLHSYTGPLQYLESALAMGAHVSFNGIVTFTKAENVRDILQEVPLSQLLLETDAPYLAPMPHRGKPNRPAWLIHVAEHVARQRQIPPAELARQTTRNALRFFRLPEADLETGAVTGSV